MIVCCNMNKDAFNVLGQDYDACRAVIQHSGICVEAWEISQPFSHRVALAVFNVWYRKGMRQRLFVQNISAERQLQVLYISK